MKQVTWVLVLAAAFSQWAFPAGIDEGWSVHSQRPEVRPEAGIDQDRGVLWLQSFGDRRVNGAWRRAYQVEGGRLYRFSGEYRSWEIEHPGRSLVVKVDWRNGAGERVGQPDYPRFPIRPIGDWCQMRDLVQAPEGAVTALIDLVLRWDARGRVEWREIGFSQEETTPSRPVTISSVNLRPTGSSGPEENLRLFGKLVDEAGKEGADLILLPEGATLVGTGKSYLEVAETVPGPSTDFLGKLARKNSTYIVAGLVEREGATFYNTAVLIDRSGAVAGRYRKVSLPREEIEGGLTPGEEFPVFETDFGRIGILICWDIQFPEGGRRLAAAGAEIILLPIWGGIDALYPARAIENQVYLVTSSYDSPTGIWDLEGKPIVQTTRDGSVATATIDLESRVLWDWLGDLRGRIPHEAAPPESH